MKIKILILMTVSIIFVTAHFLIVPVKGEMLSEEIEDNKLIVVVGEVDDSFYEKEGYIIIQNNVKSTEVGSYEVVYQSLEDGMIYTQKVEVISKEDKEYFNIDTNTIETFKDYPMVFEKSISISKNEQILLIRYITNKEKDLGHLYMYYVKNNVIIKEILLYYNQSIKVCDLLVDGDDFIIIGQIWNSLYANYDIVFVVCDKNGFRKCNKIMGGSKTDTGLTGVVLEDSYLITGITNSTDQVFDDNKKENGFLMKIDKQNYEVTNIEYCKDLLLASDVKMVKGNNGIKLLIVNLDNILLIDLNNDGKTLKEKKISFDTNIKLVEIYGKEEIKIIIEKDQQLEIGIIDNKGYQRVNILSNNLKVKNVDFFDQMLNILYIVDGGYLFVVYDEEYQKIYEKELYQVFSNNNGLFMDGQIIIEPLEDSSKVNIHQLEYLKILTMGKTEVATDSDYHDYQVVINGHKAKHNQNLLVDNVDKDTFGNYDVMYYFDEELDLIVGKKVMVNTTCGIVENGVYDKGLELIHNGAMFLNNERIESGHIIEEEGIYELELVGKNNISKVINFEVKELSLKPVIKEETLDEQIDIELVIKEYQKEQLSYNFFESEKPKENNINQQWDFMYLLPVVLTIGLGFMLVKLKY